MTPNIPSLSIIPIGSNKRSLVPWTEFQTVRADPSQLPQSDSYAAVCGAVSGNLECIDYDIKNDPSGMLLDAFIEIVTATDPDLLPKLYRQSTPSGGTHLVYRCSGQIDTNQKLATIAGKAPFETRGEGGYFLIPPSPGYSTINGDLSDLPIITPDERALLLSIARSFGDPTPEPVHRTPRVTVPSGDPASDLSPIDDYNQRATDTLDILVAHGWSIAYTSRDGTVHLTRPGKTAKQGTSATFNSPRLSRPNRLYVFSSSTVFEPGQSYSPAAVLAYLEHGGNFSNVASMLRQQGYGAAVTRRIITTDRYTETPQIVKEPLGPDEPMRYLYREQMGDADLFRSLVGETVIYDVAEKRWYRFNDFSDALAPHWHAITPSAILYLMGASLSHAYDMANSHKNSLHTTLSKRFSEIEDSLRKADTNELKEELKTQHEATRVELHRIENQRKALTKRVQQCQTSSYLRGVLALAEALCSPEYGEGDSLPWDADPWLLGTANGTIDLRKGTLVEPSPKHYIRKYVPTRYNPTAVCDRFELFIREIFNEHNRGDADETGTPVSDFIHRLLGYGITGLATEHIYPILYGENGRNGKDTLLNTLVRVLGSQLAKPVSKSVVVESGRQASGESASPQLYDLRGARIVWINETEESDRIKAGDLKALSGGSRITCRPLYGSQVSFDPTHLPLLVTNYKPSAPSTDDALWRRLALIPFTQNFVENPDPNNPNEHPVDKGLTAALAAETEGILAWLIRGCLLWQSDGLKRPEAISDETREYRDQMDESVRRFFDECVSRDVTRGKDVTVGAIHSAYLRWIKSNGGTPIRTPHAFGPHCKRVLGKTKRFSSGNGYSFIVLKCTNDG